MASTRRRTGLHGKKYGMVHYVRRDDIAIREHEMRVERGVCGAAEPARFSIRTDMVTCPKCLAILGDDSLTDDPALE